ncbi:hypothetical protein [Sorangium sp. So ce128]|uniref:hypothetical protein n=1 Tax=Sorangium sp. So ce128 TaxID=3133281 RepID=UPI003F605CEE
MRTLLRRPGLWLLIALLAASTIVMAVRARGPKVKVAVAARKDLEQRVVASGRVRVPTRVQVAA